MVNNDDSTSFLLSTYAKKGVVETEERFKYVLSVVIKKGKHGENLYRIPPTLGVA